MSMIKCFVPLVALALALAACSPSAPAPGANEPATPATTVAAAATAPSGVLPAIASTIATAAPLPVGTCGDQSGVPEADRIANTARWTTASEQDNFGYDVYRGQSKDGPFVKLTKQPLAGGGTTDETHHYSFRDDSIDPCQSYWYYVEAISTTGRREKFTPTYRAPAKRVAAPISGK